VEANLNVEIPKVAVAATVAVAVAARVAARVEKVEKV